MSRLQALPALDLTAAAARFLGLPYTSTWWHAEFVAATGFEQYRDGKVPAVRTCLPTLDTLGVELRWSVEVWNLFDATWTNRRERASFTRPVFSTHLLTFLDCSTRLRQLQPTTRGSP